MAEPEITIEQTADRLRTIPIAAHRPRSLFRQADVTRALLAVRAAGLDVSSCEIDTATGKIIVIMGAGAERMPGNELDKWLKANAG